MRIAIIGGGIVGLTTALSLAQAGFRPKVYEAVNDLRPLGVGINLLPHAVRELAELELLDRLRDIGVEIEALDYHMQDGRAVWSEYRGLKAGYGWPQIAVHRGRFHMFLLDEVRRRLGADAVSTGRALDRFEDRGDNVAAHFRDRTSGEALGAIEADILIGADGLHSSVRRHFYPDEGLPVWNGVSLFRSTTRVPADRIAPKMLWVGHADQKFIAYPIVREPDSDSYLLNWVCDLRTAAPGSTPREDWNRIVDRAELVPRFSDWSVDGFDIPAILAASGDVYEFPMVDRDPLPRWTFGRVTLAGDAAHPMYPIGSNGATQGIIDARVLAFHIATAPDPLTGLQRYEEARLAPTSRIVLGNRGQGPDRILEIARERASDPMVDIDAVIPFAERAEISASYKRLAGFDPAALNARASYSVG